MAKTDTADVTVNLTLALSKPVYSYVEASTGGGNPSEAIAKWVMYFLTQQANGGLMLDGSDHVAVAELAGSRFRSSGELRKAIERGLRRTDGQYEFTVPFDPAFIQPLEEAALSMGWTPQDVITGIVNLVYRNSWAYAWTPEYSVAMTEADYEVVAAFVGKKLFFGRDLADKIREMTGQAQQKAA